MKLVKPAALFQQVLKTCVTKQGRLLGLDVGSKYVGLAISDEHNKIATPLSALDRTKKNINVLAQDFQTMVTQLSLAGFVVGYPFNIKGQSSVDHVQDKIFIEELHKTSMLDGVSYTYWDLNIASRHVQVKSFIQELRKTSMLDGVSYTYWDLNIASECAETLLEPLDCNPLDAKTISDKFATVGILQNYLDAMNRSLGSQDLNSLE